MKPVAIIYSSNTGHTQQYAQILSEQIAIPAFSIKEAKKNVKNGSPIIYMSWLMAGNVKHYNRVKKKYNITSLIAVCLGPNGSQLDTVRKKCNISEDFPAFTVQGGMNREKLKGINKMMINMLIKMLSSSDERKPEEDAMLQMIANGGNFVTPDNLTDFLNWYETFS